MGSPTGSSLAAAKPLFDAAWRRRFRERLLRWYDRHARDLPWRASRDAYRVWISEIMLQQAEVETVKPYFLRFVERFPDIQALAAADEATVLRLWEGLGYYRRARQLHQAARILVEQHQGEFPQDIATLRSLPGIGRYTAGAVLSIAFDAREPILEANTMRLFARLLCEQEEVTRSATQGRLWQAAAEVLPRSRTGRFNQALMELGAQLCTPGNPRCGQCPVHTLCGAYRAGKQLDLPRYREKTPLEAVHEAAVVVLRGQQILLAQCAENERWAGLWDFPRFRVTQRRGKRQQEELAAKVSALTGIAVIPQGKFATIRHGVTRYRITLHCHRAVCDDQASPTAVSRPLQWLRPSELEDVPLSTTGRQIGTMLCAERD